MAAIKNVALIGGSGTVGKAIYSALIAASFNVTIVTRADSILNLPRGAKTTSADYGSLESLASAFKDADAVVSAMGAPGLAAQPKCIDAAIAAGVRRFVPSEYGCNTLNEKAGKLPVFKNKVLTSSLLREKAEQGEIEYTLIMTGPFLDLALLRGYSGIDVRGGPRATLFDNGTTRISWTTLSDTGKAVAGALLHPEETANKQVFVHTANMSQRQLMVAVEEALGISFPQPYGQLSTEKGEAEAYEKLKKGDFSGMLDFLKRGIFGEGYGTDFSGKVSNELVGIQELDEAGLRKLIVDLFEGDDA
ncbi:putative isoflavone reductase like protein P3 [Zalerion maritima]|uniref:Isoflavone reductase like protein P3 n=1 Tax=Zalerion maritima TaxID=339359 RepID=A0AAD5WMX3_9PEZI|nr:putative isoflavone reductase like protein P3 [Zalerion maritima]